MPEVYVYKEWGKLIIYWILYAQLHLIKDLAQNQIHMMLHGISDFSCQLG